MSSTCEESGVVKYTEEETRRTVELSVLCVGIARKGNKMVLERHCQYLYKVERNSTKVILSVVVDGGCIRPYSGVVSVWDRGSIVLSKPIHNRVIYVYHPAPGGWELDVERLFAEVARSPHKIGDFLIDL